MTIRDLLNYGADSLKNSSESPRLDCSILLAKVMGIDRASLFARYSDIVDDPHIEQFKKFITLRSQGYPVAYILNEKEFYGYTFYLEDGVLTPRPDTEILVETALDLIEKNSLKTGLDMCTGTGCIAITLKKECPKLDIIATDISPISERVFKVNNQKLLNNSINFIHSDLFSNLKDKKFDIIVTNPPYLTKKETEDRVLDGWKEPVLALDGGFDGLDLIHTIIDEAPNYLNNSGWLLIEASSNQMEDMKRSMESAGYKNIHILKDLASLDRIIVGKYE
ncbi:peptide chain release factor N(5)-glutamine methyltransferase [Thiospirochaeta perfilievii]|uniref:Release factor glutamine methyltransferase n=1 Tax=Thiospirochaeta perfilievii TaxID=252967 RepID=A0A5C1QAJ6_9SPIO|nr:peptide chain release factor N(5)-glutamine methyltransferase [Thiospirochaeta perfilievii]QEN03949.1 peptide chain release factor N(5)-glutamine methyltransferase [Thiospirochaeta perfilievii]